MLAVARAIFERISLYEDLVDGEGKSLTLAPPLGLGFGIYNRWLKPTGPGSTPAAFDAAQGGRLKRSIVVRDGGEVRHTTPGSHDVRLWDSFPETYLFAEAHDNGRQAIDDAIVRLEALLCDWIPTIDGLGPFSLREADIVDLAESEQFPGNVTVIVRWHATGARQMIPARR